MYQEFPELVTTWTAFSDSRGQRRAVEWLAQNSLIPDDAADRYVDGLPNYWDTAQTGASMEEIKKLGLKTVITF